MPSRHRPAISKPRNSGSWQRSSVGDSTISAIARLLRSRAGLIIVVDDGIATGATVKAALRGLARNRPARLVLAVPVAPAESLEELSAECDEIVCLATPDPFYAVGPHYRDFRQTEDAEVVRLLDEARQWSTAEPSTPTPGQLRTRDYCHSSALTGVSRAGKHAENACYRNCYRTRWHGLRSERTGGDTKGQKAQKICHFLGLVGTCWDGRDRNQNPVLTSSTKPGWWQAGSICCCATGGLGRCPAL